MRIVAALFTNDLRSVRRDPMLLYMILLPWLMVLILRLLLPGIAAWLKAGYDFSLEPFYPLVLSIFLVLQVPMMYGVVVGFLVLDERDDGTLEALRVTPVSMSAYAYYRITVAVFLSVFFTLASLPLTGLASPSALPSAVPAAILSGLMSVVLVLLLVNFAGNKVEGLALMKAFGILMLGPLAAYFIKSDWQLLLGILPSYWPARTFWAAIAGETAWPFFAAGLFYHLLLVFLLLRRFQARIGN